MSLPSHDKDTAGGTHRPGHSGVLEPLSLSFPLQDLDVVRHHVILGEALSTEALRRGGHRNSLLGPTHWLVFYNHSGQVGGGVGEHRRPCPGHPALEHPFSLEFPHLGTSASGPETSHPGRPPVHRDTPALERLRGLQPLRGGWGWGGGCSASCPNPQPEVNHVPLEGPVLEAPGRSLFGLSGVLTVGSSRCLHSHAEALRVRGWGLGSAEGRSRAGGSGWPGRREGHLAGGGGESC